MNHLMTREQFDHAYQIGLARSNAGRARGGTHRFGWAPSADEQRHVDGMSAAAEYLVALTTGRRWTSDGLVPDTDGTDVDGRIGVRWTPYTGGHLIVHPGDPDDVRCVLVTRKAYPLTIVGWCYARDAKVKTAWRSNVRYPAYFFHPRLSIELLRAETTEVDQWPARATNTVP